MQVGTLQTKAHKHYPNDSLFQKMQLQGAVVAISPPKVHSLSPLFSLRQVFQGPVAAHSLQACPCVPQQRRLSLLTQLHCSDRTAVLNPNARRPRRDLRPSSGCLCPVFSFMMLGVSLVAVKLSQPSARSTPFFCSIQQMGFILFG